MRRQDMKHIQFVGVCIFAISASLWGCGTPPSIHVSSPRVFTGDQIADLQDALTEAVKEGGGGIGDSPSTSPSWSFAGVGTRGEQGSSPAAANANPYAKRAPSFINDSVFRYLLTRDSTYNDHRLRIDSMLDQRQRISDLAEAARTFTTLQANLNAPGQEPPDATRQQEAVAEALASLADAAVFDSPFDTIDRANELYTAFFARLLRSHLDARRERVESGEEQRSPFKDDARWKFYVFVFDVHVDPGTRPNVMAGVRIEIAGAWECENEARDWRRRQIEEESKARTQFRRPKPIPPGSHQSDDNGPEHVLITHLHPTRTYDVEDRYYASDIGSTVEAALAAGRDGQSVAASRNSQRERQERRKFLSRMSKTASFSDATTHEFGWDFYPTNLQTHRKGLLDSLGNIVDESGDFVLQAYLEPGGRICVAFGLVDREVKAIGCRVKRITGPVPPAGYLGRLEENAGCFLIPLSEKQSDE